MDPITATTTIITLFGFITKLIEVGHSIKCSIEKARDSFLFVSENRRQIRDLTDDILRTLAELAVLCREHEKELQAPALLGALGNLMAEMLHVLSTCQKMSPVQPSPRFRALGFQIKLWIKRDDIEAEIRRLKEHVNKCYFEFTAFSAARIEQTTARIEDTSHRAVNITLRVEQSLIVNHVENKVKLQQLEGMMARLLLETKFGQDVMKQTNNIIASDTAHQTLEFKYLSAQALRLIDRLQQVVSNGTMLVLDTPLWDGTNLSIVKSVSPDAVLYQILGVTLSISRSPAEIPFTSIGGILSLGSYLSQLGMDTEATSWHLMTIQILHHLSRGGFHSDSRLLPNLALSSDNLSRRYQHELRWDLATEASQGAIDLCRLWQKHSPDVDYWPLLGIILITHSENLRANGRFEVAASIAEEAVAVCRKMAGQLLDTGSELSSWAKEDECKAVAFSRAFFALVAALASVDRHLAAYEAAREGFQTILKFSRTLYPHPPAALVVDTSIHQICKVAEEGGLSLVMLAENVIMFRDLARIYPELSSQFLRLLHAYVYLSQQHSPDLGKLRIFVEPASGLPPPLLDTSSKLKAHIDDFDLYGGITQDVIRAYYVRPWAIRDVFPLIRNILSTNFNQAGDVLREITSKLMTDPHSDLNTLNWVLCDLTVILPHITRAQQLVLVDMMRHIVGYIRTTTTTPVSLTHGVLWGFSSALWTAGSLDEAKAVCDEAVEHLSCSPRNEDNRKLDAWALAAWLVRRIFVLWDMGQISQAIKAAHETKAVGIKMRDDPAQVLRFCMVRKQILQRTGRHREALKLLRGVVELLPLKVSYDNCYASVLLADLADAWKLTGQLWKAVESAEQVVAACREDMEGVDMEGQKYALVHSLTTLSNCLTAVGRNKEALVAAQEASMIYTRDVPRLWGDYLYAPRREELGANAFHSLSLRLVTSGELEGALLNAEKAADLYRELVSLTPRHFPTLVNSLQNMASILWNIGRRDEGISASDEAVSIMRKVAEKETYLLGALREALDQLAQYLAETGEAERAAAATSESTEIRREIQLLPHQTDSLFLDIDMRSEDEDHTETWETSAKPEYHDGATDIEVGVGADPASLQTSSPINSMPEHDPNRILSPAEHEHCANAATEIVNPVKNRFAELLSTPIEVKLRSTPMDLLWWLLVWMSGVAFAVVWNYIQWK
ncbi:hypothetical protein DFH09DRAFT_1290726 [Mycena vulgaris]|nr:hypothetical protein DFH09DRAFT_1290726 [Mycena vulgaris]